MLHSHAGLRSSGVICVCSTCSWKPPHLYLTPRRREPESRRNRKKNIHERFPRGAELLFTSGGPLIHLHPQFQSSHRTSGSLNGSRLLHRLHAYTLRHTSVAALKPASVMRSGLQLLLLNWKTEPSRKSPVTPLKCNIVRFSFRLSWVDPKVCSGKTAAVPLALKPRRYCARSPPTPPPRKTFLRRAALGCFRSVVGCRMHEDVGRSQDEALRFSGKVHCPEDERQTLMLTINIKKNLKNLISEKENLVKI